jgi:serine/threonine protein kinase
LDIFNRVAPSIGIYKRWLSHLVEAVRALHDIDIVHRDLNMENLLWTEDGQQLIVSDLECHWGSRRAPKIRIDSTFDAGWSKQSDIYDVGCLIEGLIYGNIPLITKWNGTCLRPSTVLLLLASETYQVIDPL